MRNARTRYRLAGGAVSLLVAIFITACGVTAVGDDAAQLPQADSQTVTAMPTASSTPLAAPVTSTPTPVPPSPSPTRTRPVVTAGPTATPTATTGSMTKKLSPTQEAPQKMTVKSTRVPTESSSITVYEEMITLPTYPIWDYLVEQTDPIYNILVHYFNRLEFEADAPTPTPVDYKAVVLENGYLRLTFLPELGGRLYSAVVKATGQEIFYQNPVIKPSRYGGLEPYEANWWLATGGMEWAYPTQEHGYRWGVSWEYEVTRTATGATITLSDTAPDRVGAEVSLTLPANSAVFTVTPRLINPMSKTVPVQFWLNAALTLGSGSMSPETQFILPTEEITIHSRGEEGWPVPEAQEEISWPMVDKIDLRDYGQWANYLGFFVPDLEAPFVGAYNPETDLGVIRLIEPGTVPGTKLFAFGSSFPDRSYTDDESQYFEIWGGANAGFWPEDDILVATGEMLQWQEQWWPVAGLGGITWANPDVALEVEQTGDDYVLSVLVPRPMEITLTVLAHGTPIQNETVSANPAEPVQLDFSAPTRPIRVEITGGDGTILLNHCLDCKTVEQ